MNNSQLQVSGPYDLIKSIRKLIIHYHAPELMVSEEFQPKLKKISRNSRLHQRRGNYSFENAIRYPHSICLFCHYSQQLHPPIEQTFLAGKQIQLKIITDIETAEANKEDRGVSNDSKKDIHVKISDDEHNQELSIAEQQINIISDIYTRPSLSEKKEENFQENHSAKALEYFLRQLFQNECPKVNLELAFEILSKAVKNEQEDVHEMMNELISLNTEQHKFDEAVKDKLKELMSLKAEQLEFQKVVEEKLKNLRLLILILVQ